MICPHCAQNLLRKERPGSTCSKCRRTFVYDPKTNALRLHDLRVRRVGEKITDGGRLTVTVAQLWFALSRRTLRVKSRRKGVVAMMTGALLCAGGLAVGLSGGEENDGFLLFGIPLLICVVVGVSLMANGSSQGRITFPLSGFRHTLTHQWTDVYGALPAGVVDEARVPAGALKGSPRAALLCPDPGVLAFLAANGMPERFGIALATDVRQVPDAVPVIVLHDADANGCLLARRTRDALPGRTVVDAGMPLRAVMSARGAVPVRSRQPAPQLVRQLRDSAALTTAEVDWLAKGWSCPLLGVPPAKLLAVVTRAAERVTAADSDRREEESDRREAEAVGFLTWPGEGAR
ncbi:hypothetical protein ACIOJD_04060 [Streptomyces sp. NPDC088116]|uniref:hypothetical protein n=1 Tax=Streptomyces sp. NPDC088116 TaxID=3365825 RepID=UPI0037F4C4FA